MTEQKLAFQAMLLHNQPADMPKTDSYYDLLTTAARSPEGYKVCMVCGNIVDTTANECPYCSAYRFEDDAEFVVNTALDLVTQPRTSVLDTAQYEED